MRREFKSILFDAMLENDKIIVVTADLGYKFLDEIRDKLPNQFINVMAAEQLMLGTAIGLALGGKIPLCYSISSFLLRRPYEFIKLYLNDEQIPVKLLGGGRNKDYEHQGKTHWSEDDKYILKGFPNIERYWPNTIEELKENFQEFLYSGKPSYLNLKR